MERRMSFDAAAETYHRGRPPYPDAVFDLLARRCGLRPGARVLEIGAGTGLATRPLLAAGAHVVAVEPGAHFAAILAAESRAAAILAAGSRAAGSRAAGSRAAGSRAAGSRAAGSRAAGHPGARLDVVVGDFETAEVPGRFDLAVAAMSLHWLDPAVAVAKIARLVRPGGRLAAWWTEFGPGEETTPFRDRLDEVYRDLLPAEPGYRDSRSHVLDTDRWRQRLTEGGWFDDVAVDTVAWHQTLTPAGARDLWGTFPNIAELAPSDREQFLSRLAAIVDDHGGTVDDPRLTVVYTATRTAVP